MVMEGVKLRPRAKGPPEGELSCLGQLWMTHPNDHFGSRSQTGPPADHLRISPTPEHPHDTPDSEDKTKSNCLHCCRACQIADLAVNDSSRARKGARTHLYPRHPSRGQAGQELVKPETGTDGPWAPRWKKKEVL